MNTFPVSFEKLSTEEKLDLHRAHYSGREIEVWSEFSYKWVPHDPSAPFGPRGCYRIVARPLVIPWFCIAERFKVAQLVGDLIWFYGSRADLHAKAPNGFSVNPENFVGFRLGDTNYEIQERPE